MPALINSLYAAYPSGLALQDGSGLLLQDGAALLLQDAAPIYRRDDYVFRDIEDRIEALGFFGLVQRGASPAESPLPGSEGRLCWFRRQSWKELRTGSPSIVDRVVQYSLWIAIRGDEPAQTADLLQQAEAYVLNALNLVSLASITYPMHTTLGQGVEEAVGNTGSQVRLSGSFRYALDDGASGRALSDPP